MIKNFKKLKKREDDEWQTKTFERLNEAVARTKEYTGADFVMVIAVFREGDKVHVLDGGTSPVPVIDLYQSMADAHLQALEADPDYRGVIN